MLKLKRFLLLAAAMALASCASSGSAGPQLAITGYAEVSGDAVVATDGQRAVAVGTGYGEIGLRLEQGKLLVLPFLVESGQVYLFADGKDTTVAFPGPIPAWAAALLGSQMVSELALTVE